MVPLGDAAIAYTLLLEEVEGRAVGAKYNSIKDYALGVIDGMT